MKEERVGMRIIAIVMVTFVTAAAFHRAVAESPADAGAKDFLARAYTALKAVQAMVGEDKILAPLTKAKIEEGSGGQGYLTINTETPESWPNFPSKPRNLARGYGRLRIDVYAELPQVLPCTPFLPPRGCHYGSTYLIVPETSSKILVETTTSDPEAQHRLVGLIVKELGKAGITVRPDAAGKLDPNNRPRGQNDFQDSK